MARRGASLESLLDTCRAAAKEYSTLGVSASGCIVPGHTQPLIEVKEGEMELGLGLHGEAGVKTMKVRE